MTLRLRHALATAASLLVSLSARQLGATDLPACGGHITDRSHVLTDEERLAFVADIDKLDVETLIDFAVWIPDASDEPGASLGQRAYKEWRIGRVWEGGILVVLPTTARAIVVEDGGHPVLTPAEAEELVSADRPDQPVRERLDGVVDEARTLLLRKVDRHGPAHRLRWVLAPLALLLAAAALKRRDPTPLE
jgi:hypothetical protein